MSDDAVADMWLGTCGPGRQLLGTDGCWHGWHGRHNLHEGERAELNGAH